MSTSMSTRRMNTLTTITVLQDGGRGAAMSIMWGTKETPPGIRYECHESRQQKSAPVYISYKLNYIEWFKGK